MAQARRPSGGPWQVRLDAKRSRWQGIVGRCLVLLLAVAPPPARAQVFTPSLASPIRGEEISVQLAGGFGPSGGLALEGVRRHDRGPFDLGLRIGIGDVDRGALLLLGADYRGPVEEDLAPLSVATTGGIQLAVGGRVGFGVTGGVSVGSTFAAEALSVTPYLNPRLALVETLRSGSGFDVAVLADLGADVRFAPSLVGRVALGLGGPTANFSLGLAWR